MPAPPLGACAPGARGAPELSARATATPQQRRTSAPPPPTLRFSLGRTRQLFGRVNDILEADEITDGSGTSGDTLISGDVGVTTTERLLGTLRACGWSTWSAARAARAQEELALLLGGGAAGRVRHVADQCLSRRRRERRQQGHQHLASWRTCSSTQASGAARRRRPFARRRPNDQDLGQRIGTR